MREIRTVLIEKIRIKYLKILLYQVHRLIRRFLERLCLDYLPSAYLYSAMRCRRQDLRGRQLPTAGFSLT